ncbi:hypothetical protein DFH27DRAFT_566373 [Peziza echinospora]|nr:hypothetical protein DFH27DRAFT_566373 [Peziza echinospora]
MGGPPPSRPSPLPPLLLAAPPLLLLAGWPGLPAPPSRTQVEPKLPLGRRRHRAWSCADVRQMVRATGRPAGRGARWIHSCNKKPPAPALEGPQD